MKPAASEAITVQVSVEASDCVGMILVQRNQEGAVWACLPRNRIGGLLNG